MQKRFIAIEKARTRAFAFLYLLGVPVGFAWISQTGIPGYCFALFLLLFIGQAWSIYLGFRSRFWPTAQGTVLSSSVASYLDSEIPNSYWYDPKVLYRYTVDGQEYENNILSFKEYIHTPDKKFAESIAAKYPSGSNVTVYYKPNSPTYSALEPDVAEAWPWLLLIVLFFIALGFGICLAVQRTLL